MDTTITLDEYKTAAKQLVSDIDRVGHLCGADESDIAQRVDISQAAICALATILYEVDPFAFETEVFGD